MATMSVSAEQAAKLVSEANKMRERAHAPYSQFHVGAALLAEDGTVFQGCNVENASYGLTICAERTAICTAVAAGHKKFRAMAIVTDLEERMCPPCGACRQVMAEFGDYDVLAAMPDGSYECHTTMSLLPGSFSDKDLVDAKRTPRSHMY